MIKWMLTYADDEGKLFNKLITAPREKREAMRKGRRLCKERGWTFGGVSVPPFVVILGYKGKVRKHGIK